MEFEMFSRNEKYGQALHLQYGFEANTHSAAKIKRAGFFSSLVSYFTAAKSAPSQTQTTNQLELDLDKAFITQAVHNELRNTDAAANENGPALRHKDIA
jgi:hypothetical protein